MGEKIAKIDDYIAVAPEYARPILERVRDVYHTACPEVIETWKWSHPFFEFDGIIGNMGAHKSYVRLAFWKGSLIESPQGIFTDDDGVSRNIKAASLDALPRDDVLTDIIRQAVMLNSSGISVERPPSVPIVIDMPEDFAVALAEDPHAPQQFDEFTKSKRKEYIEWIDGAKQAATRTYRISKAVAQIAEGKALNWKYEKR